MGLAALQYVSDYDEAYACGHSFFGIAGRGWAGQLYPYVKATDAFTCPDDTFHKSKLPTVSYALNMQFESLTSPRQVSNIVSTAQTVYLFEIFDNETFSPSVPCPDFGCESISGAAYGGANTGASLDNNNQVLATGQMFGDTVALPTNIMKSAVGRHSDGSCFLFADGHAKWLKPGMVSCGYSNGLLAYQNPLGIPCGGLGTDGGVYSATTDCKTKSLAGTFSLK
jgi:prepilin-type processing-associated H-X9-DG protein